MKLETVSDVIKVQSECVQLSAVLELMAHEIPGLLPTGKENLFRASALIDFFGEEVLMSLKVSK